MRAILIRPETDRAGLTGKPLINSAGVVGAIGGSFMAGQRVTLINLRGISAKIAEAQRAINGAGDNIRRAGETIDDIKNGANQLANALNDYWSRWDKKGVHDRYGNIQFLATATSLDKVRTAMLGESVDPAPISSSNILPRGMWWDPCFEWQNHAILDELSDELAFEFSTHVYSTGNFYAYQISAGAQLTALLVVINSIGAILKAQSNVLLQIQNTALAPWAGPLTKAASSASVGPLSNIVFAMDVTAASPAYATQISTCSGVFATAMILFSALCSMITTAEVDELCGRCFGNYRANYAGSPLSKNTLHEAWYTIAVFPVSNIIIANSLMSTYTSLMSMTLVQEIRALISFSAALASLKTASTTPDITTSYGSYPNPVGISFASAAFFQTYGLYAFSQPLIRNITSIRINLSTFPTLVGLLMTLYFYTSRVFNEKQEEMNSNTITSTTTAPIGSDFTVEHDAFNETGTLNNLPLANSSNGSIAQLLQFLPSQLISNFVKNPVDMLLEMILQSQEETASKASSGSVGARDCYVKSVPNDLYVDWYWNEVNTAGLTATIGSIAGTGNVTQMFYSNNFVRRTGGSKGTLINWSHVFDGNLFNVKAKQIGNRNIEKTIVLKTRYDFGSGIYRAFVVLVKCTGSDKLWLLMERDMTRWYSGDNADVMMAEQVIYNFDPVNYGDFFTSTRTGKIAEVFYYTFDGHIISCRPNMAYHDNYLLGEFVNREVDGYDDFWYSSQFLQPDHGSAEGDINSYYNRFA